MHAKLFHAVATSDEIIECMAGRKWPASMIAI